MDLKAVLEISIVLENFRNIDLISQGLYQVEILCYYEKELRKFKAQPSSFEIFDSDKTHAVLHNLSSGSINESTSSIKSRIFFIRFSEEKIKLHEAATFYLEIDIENTYSFVPIFVRINLLHFQISKRLVSTGNNSLYLNSLTVVDSRTFKITNPISGIAEFVPINFDVNWFCSVDSIFLVNFYDFKVPFNDSGFFSKILFSDRNGKLKNFIGGQEINRKYSEFVSLLALVYEDIWKKIETLQEKFKLTENLPEKVALPLNFSPKIEGKTFAEYLSSHNPLEVSESILSEIKSISTHILELLNTLKSIIISNPRKICKFFRFFYYEKLESKLGEFIIKDHPEPKSDTKVIHTKHVKKLRKNAYFANIEPLSIEQLNFFADILTQPVVFEELDFSAGQDLEKLTVPVSKIKSKHVVVLVHGFQGTSQDLRFLQSFISLAYPRCVFMESTFNEGKTEGCISEMGFRLAKELLFFLAENFPNNTPTVSFIGHSLGGLIIRAALPSLSSLASKFHLFLSLSTPHLGFMYSSKLVRTGMWLLQRIKKFKCLQQLCFEDSDKIENAFLYLLSKSEGLEWFKFVALVGSAQDDYAPFESARVEVCEQARNDKKMGKFYLDMVKNLSEKIRTSALIKIDAHFYLRNNMDSFIGRSAHMMLLENQDFLRVLVYRYPGFFE